MWEEQPVAEGRAGAVANRAVVRHTLRTLRRQTEHARPIQRLVAVRFGDAVDKVAFLVHVVGAELDAAVGEDAGGVAGGKGAAGGVAVRVEARRAVLDVVPAA